MEFKANDKKSLTELDFIIKNLNSELQKKIPEEVIEGIHENMDMEYEIKIDTNKPYTEQEYLPETKALFSLIISEYLCSDKEKKKWKEFDQKYIQFQNEKLSSANYVDIFKKKQNNTEKVNKELEIYKESLWSKIINKMKGIFCKRSK